jgi:hypothetical protein
MNEYPTNHKMFSLKLTLLLAFFVLFVSSGPVSCESGSRYMGSLLEEERTLDDEDPCKDKDVCRFDCAKFFPYCKEKAYFADFVNYATGEKPSTVAQIYMDVCIRNSKSNSWMYKFLLATTVRLVNSYAVAKAKGSISSLIKILRDSQVTKLVYMTYVVENLLVFQKLCDHNPGKLFFF